METGGNLPYSDKISISPKQKFFLDLTPLHHVHSLTIGSQSVHCAICNNLIFGEISTYLKIPTLLGEVPANDFMKNC